MCCPGADPPNRLFNQPALATRKLTYLAANGYEIGNHTLWHANLSKYPEPVVRSQIATAQEWIQQHVPGYRPRTLALPDGGLSQGGPLGEARRRQRHHVSPRRHPDGGRGCGTFAIRQEHSIPITCRGSRPSSTTSTGWLTYFERHPEERYVSDGEPGTITVPAKIAARGRAFPGLRVVERP